MRLPGRENTVPKFGFLLQIFFYVCDWQNKTLKEAVSGFCGCSWSWGVLTLSFLLRSWTLDEWSCSFVRDLLSVPIPGDSNEIAVTNQRRSGQTWGWRSRWVSNLPIWCGAVAEKLVVCSRCKFYSPTGIVKLWLTTNLGKPTGYKEITQYNDQFLC